MGKMCMSIGAYKRIYTHDCVCVCVWNSSENGKLLFIQRQQTIIHSQKEKKAHTHMIAQVYTHTHNVEMWNDNQKLVNMQIFPPTYCWLQTRGLKRACVYFHLIWNEIIFRVNTVCLDKQTNSFFFFSNHIHWASEFTWAQSHFVFTPISLNWRL